MTIPTELSCLRRRTFLSSGSLVLLATSLPSTKLFADSDSSTLRVGLVTDLHYADKAPAGTRHYRESLNKLEETASQFAESKPAFVVELGDLIDAADAVDVELGYLKTINQKLSEICPERHYVLGNHCVDMLKKEEFLAGIEQEKSFYSFDHAGIHFVVLDACFRSDGQPYGRKNSQWNDANIPVAELEWLTADLKANAKPTILFAHQRLDVANDHGVKNSGEVRKILEASGQVLAVLQGHSHQNDLNVIGGIHYCTLRAMVEGSGVESSGYSLMDIKSDGTIHLSGFRKQKSYDF